ncbi:hypothetical protein Shyd_93750 [Streptomyces hydrogenans]|uniref:Uncharacterized protein n=1 Tax=Streptomyces hydrogenans TaxID=1873719 RepID=A0ABQ3PSJ1_9ACTN|nr:hypothetical protein Shyd_93750 [Streptomyces hydrogenans]
MRKEQWVGNGQPEYQRVMEDLRQRMPPTAVLQSETRSLSTRPNWDRSTTSPAPLVRRAVTELTSPKAFCTDRQGRADSFRARPTPVRSTASTAELSATVQEA